MQNGSNNNTEQPLQAHFATAVAPVGSNAWIERCWSVLQAQWSSGNHVQVEEFLTEDFAAAISPAALVDLAYAEYALRKECGENPDHESFLRRFPQVRSELARQLEFHDGMCQEPDVLPATDVKPVVQIDTDVLPAAGFPSPGSPSAMRFPVEANPAKKPIPAHIGKYQVMRRLGVGGQSEVFLAWHPNLSKEVVIKLARQGRPWEVNARGQFEAEGRSLAALEHPHLVRVHDVDFHDELPYLVMDHVRGRTLEQFVREDKPAAEIVACLLSKVARGLAAAHRVGIVHLDLKPQNILVDEKGEPRLIDFGLARRADAWHVDDLAEGSVRGTLIYMAPEQALGKSQALSPRTDVFGLGAVLYFAVTGQPPYPQVSLTEGLARVQAGEWDRERLMDCDISPQLRNLCSRALAASPDDRPPTMEAFAQQLDACEQPPKLRRWQLSAAALAIGLILTFVGWRVLFPSTVRGQAGETMLAVDVWDRGTKGYLGLSNATPVRNRDQVRVKIALPADTEAGLYLFTSDGKLKELAHYEASPQATTWRYPSEAETAAPLEGPPGTEVLIVCGKRKGSTALSNLDSAALFSAPWPQLPGQSVLRATIAGVEFEQRSRGFGPAEARPDAEEAVCAKLESLRKSLGSETPVFEAIAFGHAR